MAVHVREPQQERGFARRDAVLEGAASVFERYGYGQSSLKQITAASGATTGTVYFYFSTKESIAVAVIDEQNRRTFAAFQEIAAQYSGMEGLVRTSKAVADALLTDVVVRAGIRLSLEQGTLTTPTAHFYEQWMEGVAEAVARAQAHGEVVSSLPAQRLARTIVPYFTGVHVVSDIMSGREDLYEEVWVMWQILLQGLASADHRARLTALVDELFGGEQPRARTLRLRGPQSGRSA